MSTARAVSTVALAFLASQILAVIVHGFVLSADYEPFEGTLLRAAGGDQTPWQMLFLPVAHLSYVCALVWVYARLRLEGSIVARGLQLGLLGWVIGQVPLWLLWYAQQPWPGALVAKQLSLDSISSLLIGLVIAAVADVRARAEVRSAVRA